MKYSLKVWFQTQENAKYKLYFTVMTVQWDSYQKLPLSLEKKLHLCPYINIDLNIINPFSSALDLFLLFITCIFSMSSSPQPLHNSMRWTVYFFLITIQANNEKHMWKKTKLSCGLNGTRHLFSTQTWITLIIIKQRSLLLGNWGLVFTCLWLLHIPPS